MYRLFKGSIWLILLGLIISSCNVEQSSEKQNDEENSTLILKSERQDIKEDLNTLKTKIENRMVVIEDRIQNTSGKVKSDLEELNKRLESQKQNIELALDDVEEASVDTWKDTKSKVTDIVKNVENDIEGLNLSWENDRSDEDNS